VLDTNVILDDARILEKLEGKIVIPFQVLEEIDLHKKDRNEVGANARYFTRQLNEISKLGDLLSGVKAYKADISAVPWHGKAEAKLSSLGLSDVPDNRIVATAMCYKNSIFLTNDMALRLKSISLGQKSEGYTLDIRTDNIDGIYRGMSEIIVEPDAIDTIYSKGAIKSPVELSNNQFAHIQSAIDTKHAAIARYYDGMLIRLTDYKNISGIRPRNMGQAMIMDSLMAQDITLVTMLGRAGCGKTLCALAAALEQTLGNKPDYDKIVLMKAPVPVGIDVGFLPGNLFEKILPHFQSYLDNLEVLMPRSEKTVQAFITHLIDMGKLEMTPPTYIRGRSLPKTFIICDEAQNLTKDEIKTIATRVGEGSKLVVMGDIHQIDRHGLDFSNNGLTHLIESFKGQDCAAHITLTKGERSSFSELASEIL
jgi:PhoH-like ATPase